MSSRLARFSWCVSLLWIAACAGKSSDPVTLEDAGADAAPDAPPLLCCPIDPAPISCMRTGGATHDLRYCPEDCDFYCTSHWRVIKDDAGCDVWRYDTRSPTPGEGADCNPLGDDAGSADADDGG